MCRCCADAVFLCHLLPFAANDGRLTDLGMKLVTRTFHLIQLQVDVVRHGRLQFV